MQFFPPKTQNVRDPWRTGLKGYPCFDIVLASGNFPLSTLYSVINLTNRGWNQICSLCLTTFNESYHKRTLELQDEPTTRWPYSCLPVNWTQPAQQRETEIKEFSEEQELKELFCNEPTWRTMKNLRFYYLPSLVLMFSWMIAEDSSSEKKQSAIVSRSHLLAVVYQGSNITHQGSP